MITTKTLPFPFGIEKWTKTKSLYKSDESVLYLINNKSNIGCHLLSF